MSRAGKPVFLFLVAFSFSLMLQVSQAGALPVRIKTMADAVLASGADGSSRFPVLSDDGLTVAFYSEASNLVSDDSGNEPQIFVFTFNHSDLIAVAPCGDDAKTGRPDVTAFPWGLSLSGEGRYVAFVSHSDTLASGDNNGAPDVFLMDRARNEITLVSEGLAGSAAGGGSFSPSVSGDGRYVAFMSSAPDLVESDENKIVDIFVRDMQTGKTEKISAGFDGTEADGHSMAPATSDMGRFTAFTSEASNLVSGDLNGERDVFIHDGVSGEISRVSVAGKNVEAAGESFSFGVSISGDGRYVAFLSKAPNLVPGDSNGGWDMFVRDVSLGITTRGSLGGKGKESMMGSARGSLSRNGRFLVFASDSDDLVPGDTNHGTDVFIRDLNSGSVERLSLAEDGSEVFSQALDPVVNADGSVVAFSARVADPATGEPSRVWNVFVRDMKNGRLWLITTPFAAP